MNSWDILGFAYDAAVHCSDCAVKRFGAKVLNSSVGLEDSEGNEPHPIFANDEMEGPELCDTCGGWQDE